MTTPQESKPEESRTVHHTQRVWSPAQIVAGLLGLGFVVIGGVALVRVGFSDLTATATVGWYAHTGILAIVEVVLGLLFLSAAARATEARTSCISLGVLMVALGLIAVIEPEGTATYLGDSLIAGWTWVAAGAVSALVGLVSPLVTSDRGVPT